MARTCGTWLTSAVDSSWTSSVSTCTVPPSGPVTSRSTVVNASGRVVASTVRAQRAPASIAGSDASKPECSVPAMGCAPTYRASSPADRTASRTAPLTLPTSVTTVAPRTCRATSAATARMARSGTASTRTSGSSAQTSATSPTTRRPAARAAARVVAVAS